MQTTVPIHQLSITIQYILNIQPILNIKGIILDTISRFSCNKLILLKPPSTIPRYRYLRRVSSWNTIFPLSQTPLSSKATRHCTLSK